MAVPKNYNQLEKRVESLEELTYYEVSYVYEFTDEFKKELETEELGTDQLNEAINGIKKFAALNDDLANKKITEWLDSLTKQGILSDYEITEVKTLTFLEKLREDKLIDILEYNKGDE